MAIVFFIVLSVSGLSISAIDNGGLESYRKPLPARGGSASKQFIKSRNAEITRHTMKILSKNADLVHDNENIPWQTVSNDLKSVFAMSFIPAFSVVESTVRKDLENQRIEQRLVEEIFFKPMNKVLASTGPILPKAIPKINAPMPRKQPIRKRFSRPPTIKPALQENNKKIVPLYPLYPFFKKDGLKKIKPKQSLAGNNLIENFFSQGFISVTIIASKHDVQKEYFENGTISAIPIPLPLKKPIVISEEIRRYMPDREQPGLFFSLVATCLQSRSKKCNEIGKFGGFTLSLPNKGVIKNVCTINDSYSFVEEFKYLVMPISGVQDNYTVIGELEMGFRSYPDSGPAMLIPVNEGEEIFVVLTNRAGDERIFKPDIAAINTKIKEKPSFISQLMSEWVDKISSNDLNELITFKENIQLMNHPLSDGIMQTMNSEEFTKYQEQVVKFIDTKIETLKKRKIN